VKCWNAGGGGGWVRVFARLDGNYPNALQMRRNMPRVTRARTDLVLLAAHASYQSNAISVAGGQGGVQRRAPTRDRHVNTVEAKGVSVSVA